MFKWYNVALLSLCASVSQALLPAVWDNEAGSCAYTDTCTVSGVEGVCVSESNSCCPGGSWSSGYCSGSSDILCCTLPNCTTPSGEGTCKSTSTCSGKSVSGYCQGPSDITCCVGSEDDNGGGGDDIDDGDDMPTGSIYGVDTQDTVTTSDASCLKSKGVDLIIVRAFRSTGAVDTTACPSLENAKTEKISIRDAYIFPCPTCSASATSQIKSMTSYLISTCNSSWSGRIWLDIEGSQYWLGSSSSNQAWYKSLVDACTSSGYDCGVYGSKSQWEDLFGSSTFSYGSSLPLWYAHYDDVASFSDYSSYSFGGWTTPSIKQYEGDVDLCNQNLDQNYAVFS
jgi:hypothetical protein